MERSQPSSGYRLRLIGEKLQAIVPAELDLKYPHRYCTDSQPYNEITDIINNEIDAAYKSGKNECQMFIPKYSVKTGMVLDRKKTRQHIEDTFGPYYNLSYFGLDCKTQEHRNKYGDDINTNTDNANWLSISWPKRQTFLDIGPDKAFARIPPSCGQ